MTAVDETIADAVRVVPGVGEPSLVFNRQPHASSAVSGEVEVADSTAFVEVLRTIRLVLGGLLGGDADRVDPLLHRPPARRLHGDAWTNSGCPSGPPAARSPSSCSTAEHACRPIPARSTARPQPLKVRLDYRIDRVHQLHKAAREPGTHAAIHPS